MPRRRARAAAGSRRRARRTKSLEEIAEGFLDIAVDNMAAAIRKISIARGHDVTRYTLACFGGAGGQHACRGRRRARHGADPDPPAGGRAVGLWHRPRRREGDPRGELAEAARRGFFGGARDAREARARSDWSSRAFEAEHIELRTAARGCARRAATRRSNRRSRPAEQMRADFAALHRTRFGYIDEGAEVIVDALVVEAVGSILPGTGRGARSWRRSGAPLRQLRWSPPRTGERSIGPALIFDPTSTIVVEPGWRAERGGRRHAGPDPRRAARARQCRRHRRRPGPARDLQQSVHGHRRGNGRRAAVDRDSASTSRSGSISPARSSTPTAR